MEVKKIVLRTFFVLEIAVFLFFYFLGSHGLTQLLTYKQQNNVLERDIYSLEQDIKNLRRSIKDFQENTFHKEKFAREELQMAYPHEELYLYPDKNL